jgi:hypothetical protein
LKPVEKVTTEGEYDKNGFAITPELWMSKNGLTSMNPVTGDGIGKLLREALFDHLNK